MTVGAVDDATEGALDGARVEGSSDGKANGTNEGEVDGAIEYSQLHAAVLVSGNEFQYPSIEYKITV